MRSKKYSSNILIFFLLINISAFSADLKKTILSINGHELKVEVAKENPDKQKGLQGRTYLHENYGMLFVYKKPQTLSFWMKDTLIPLSIAFINKKCIITQIEDMEPKDLTPVKSNKNCSFALEVNKGWFEANRIKTGDEVKGLK